MTTFNSEDMAARFLKKSVRFCKNRGVRQDKFADDKIVLTFHTNGPNWTQTEHEALRMMRKKYRTVFENEYTW